MAPSSTRRRLVWAVLALSLLTAVFGGWGGYHQFQRRQVRQLIAQAGQFTAGQQWDQAYQKVLAALQLAPADGDGLRLAARILTRFQRQDAFSFWQRAFASRPASTPERLEVLGLALATRRFDVAELHLKAALEQKPIPPEILRAAALLCGARGDTAGAIQFARAFLEHTPRDADLRFLLGRCLLVSEAAQARREGRATMWALAQAEHATAWQALVTLAALPDLSSEEIQQALKRLAAYAPNDVWRDLLAQDYRLRLEPKRRLELIQAMIRQYQAGPSDEVIALARWLNDKGEYPKVTQLITLEAALSDKDLFLIYGDALASQAEWAQLAALLARPQLPIEPVVAELYRARVARELKNDRQADTHWAQAHALAGDNARALGYLAEYAERLGQPAEAIKAYRRLTRDPAAARAAFLGLLHLTERTENTAALRVLMREIAARFPDDPAPRIDLAYLDLLAGENLAHARAVAQQLCDQNPDMPAYRTTLALAYLRQSQPAAAQALFKGLNLDSTPLLPGWQAVRAAALGASGQRDAARQLARQIAADRLKPEERALVQPWL